MKDEKIYFSSKMLLVQDKMMDENKMLMKSFELKFDVFWLPTLPFLRTVPYRGQVDMRNLNSFKMNPETLDK